MKRKLSAVLAVILCLALALGTFALAEPAPAEESPAPGETPAAEASGPDAPEEVIYGRLDNSGRPRSAYAVVALDVTEPGTVTHYAQYTEVENLTDTSPIEYSGGKVTLEAESAGRYHYQGKLRKAQLPWDIQISYKLNGEDIDPDDLGGKSGELEVNIHTETNSGFDPYYADNYMLQISVTLPGELCSEITARNGTVASAGSDKTITFVVLPGGEGDVGFSAEVENFEMGGFTIGGVPYDMTSMMGDMEEVDVITEGLEQLADGISSLTYAAGQLSSGAGELSDNSSALTDASDQIQSALQQISDGIQGFDISEMTGGLDQLAELPGGLTKIAAGLQTMKDGLTNAMSGLTNVPEISDAEMQQLETLMNSVGSLSGVQQEIESSLKLKLAAALAPYMQYMAGLPEEAIEGIMSAITSAVSSAITESSLGKLASAAPDPKLLDKLSGMMELAGSMSDMTSQLRQLTAGLDAAINGLMTMASGISSGLNEMTNIDTSGIDQLKSGMAELSSSYVQFNEGLKAYADGVAALSDGVDSYYGGMFTLNSETSAIPDILDEALGGGDEEKPEPVSYLDERNGTPSGVQFVLSTEGVTAPEEDAPETPDDEPKGFFEELWDKITALF